MSLKQEIERAFSLWLEWSEDAEILALLDLTVAALRGRGYRVTYEVRQAQDTTHEGGER